jgi:hypothetical protein
MSGSDLDRAVLGDHWRGDGDPGPVPPAEVAGAPPLELQTFLDTAEATYDWLVEHVLERGDRVVLTGSEGRGKMTLLRQWAVQMASGIHPFTLEDMPAPLRVLLIDLQETEAQLRRALRPLRLSAGGSYRAGQMFVQPAAEGLNVLGLADAARLRGWVQDTQPDVLIAGPVYKLADGDPTEEATGKRVARVLDEIRADGGPALLLEAHSPYSNGRTARAERPYGWSGWSRWPEFGLCLTDQDVLAHWRGPRDQRQWPFMPATRPRDVLWARIAGYCAEAGSQITERDLAQLTGSPQPTVHRAIDEHRAEWDALGRFTDSGE